MRMPSSKCSESGSGAGDNDRRAKPVNPKKENDKEKRKKETVLKKSTVISWKKYWLEFDEGETSSGKLKIHCAACKEFPDKSKIKGAVNTDPFVQGTSNVKKYSADRHERTKSHKKSYGKY